MFPLLFVSLYLLQIILTSFDGHLHSPYSFKLYAFILTYNLIYLWYPFLLGDPDLHPVLLSWVSCMILSVYHLLPCWCPLRFGASVADLFISALLSCHYFSGFLVSGTRSIHPRWFCIFASLPSSFLSLNSIFPLWWSLALPLHWHTIPVLRCYNSVSGVLSLVFLVSRTHFHLCTF